MEQLILKLGGRLSGSFDLYTFEILLLLAFILCISNFLFLRKHKFTREQIESNRKLHIHFARKTIAEFKIPPFIRVISEFASKLGTVAIIYMLLTYSFVGVVALGIFISIALLILQLIKIIRLLLHPKSLLQRKYLLFKKNPTFIRQRLCFELLRRFLNISLFFAFISYGLFRICPECINIDGNVTASIHNILLHFQSAVSGLTSLGRDPFIFYGDLGSSYIIIRSLTGYLILMSFVGIVLNGMSTESIETVFNNNTKYFKNQINGDGRFVEKITTEAIRKVDVETIILLEIEEKLAVDSKDIKLESDVINDLGADSLDVIELQSDFEEIFGTGPINDSDIENARKVKDIIELFYNKCTAIKYGK